MSVPLYEGPTPEEVRETRELAEAGFREHGLPGETFEEFTARGIHAYITGAFK